MLQIDQFECVCKHCGIKFNSKSQRKYCSFDCYVSSPDFLNMARANGKKASKKTEIICLHCGSKKTVPESKAKRKFCSVPCFRTYFAERYDRWYANPKNIPLPQAYDEFLARTELECPLDGCSWKGKFLGAHVNACHGIKAKEFKKLAGFNTSTGLVSIDIHQQMSDHSKLKTSHNLVKGDNPPAYAEDRPERVISLEAKEHLSKTLAERWSQRHPVKVKCQDCSAVVITKVPERTKYCKKCCNRRADQRRRDRERQPAVTKACQFCKTLFETNLPRKVFCNDQCRFSFYRS